MKTNPNLVIPALISIFLLILATFFSDLPHGFYQLLRLVLFVSCIIIGWDCYKQTRYGWLWSVGFVGILFNPVSPVGFDQDTWRWIDALIACLFIVYVVRCQSQGLAEIWGVLASISKKHAVRMTAAIIGVLIGLIITLIVIVAISEFFSVQKAIKLIRTELKKESEENSKFIDPKSQVFSDGKVLLDLKNTGTKPVKNVKFTIFIEPPQNAAESKTNNSQSTNQEVSVKQLERIPNEMLKVGAEYIGFDGTMELYGSIEGCSTKHYEYKINLPKGSKKYFSQVTEADYFYAESYDSAIENDAKRVALSNQKSTTLQALETPVQKCAIEEKAIAESLAQNPGKPVLEFRNENVAVKFLTARIQYVTSALSLSNENVKSLVFIFTMKIINKEI